MCMLRFIVPIALLLSTAECAKILAIFPMAAPSHHILGSSLLRELAEKGHDVTMISPFSEKSLPKNGTYKDIILTGFKEEQERNMKHMNMFDMEKTNLLLLLPFFTKMMLELTEKTLQHENVQKLINSNEKFDLVIVEQFLNEAHKALSTHFNAPLITFSTMGANTWVNPIVANPQPLSYIGEVFLGYPSNMTFTQRLTNSALYTFQQLMHHLYVLPQQDKILKKYFPNLNHDIYDITYNSSLVFLNSHPSLNQPVPLVPSMIEIGGFHVKPAKKLPKELQDYLDSAKEGVIYFSLGSNIKSSLLPPEKRQAILNTFAKLKLNVLWKWEEDVLPGQPSNVRLGKWLPQQDILAHPNVKLFITHGGLLSTTETIYHGKPALAIPIAADQKMNALRIEQQGIGLKVNFHDLSEESLSEKINTILANPSYAKNAKTRSKSFHDRLVKPMDTAIYWVEYVIRHGGAPHLRVAGLDLPWYTYHLLDVITVVFTAIFIGLFVFYKITKMILCKLCKAKTSKVKTN